jgi:hypothetical protein
VPVPGRQQQPVQQRLLERLGHQRVPYETAGPGSLLGHRRTSRTQLLPAPPEVSSRRSKDRGLLTDRPLFQMTPERGRVDLYRKQTAVPAPALQADALCGQWLR